MPRARFLQKALRGKVPPTPVAMPQKQVKHPPTKPEFDESKSSPTTYSQFSQTVNQRQQQAISSNQPHFAVGGQEIYFPWAKITLLRPSARMTPYQAQFQVPRHFNKLDLRDYLWHVYGLRALNITTQIKWSEWTRSLVSRYRTPQVKKMIIDMEEPFLWPQPDQKVLNANGVTTALGFQKYRNEVDSRTGSDLRKPTKAFDGVLGPYPEAPQQYVPKRLWNQLKNDKVKAKRLSQAAEDEKLIEEFLKL